MVENRRLHRVEDVAEPPRIALRDLAGKERRVLEQHRGDELGMVLSDPPRDDASERVPDEQRRTRDELAENGDRVAP